MRNLARADHAIVRWGSVGGMERIRGGTILVKLVRLINSVQYFPRGPFSDRGGQREVDRL
jgi:hypothetical protein